MTATTPTSSGIKLTAQVGTNADLFPEVLGFYVEQGSRVLDMTWGRGAFWRNVDLSNYQLVTLDQETAAEIKADFTRCPFVNDSFDAVILDPPYMHSGATVKESINSLYLNKNTSHESMIRLYAGGILEAARLLVRSGRLIVKSQDETESGKQRLSHLEIIHLLEMLGFRILDLFVLVQETTPAIRFQEQKSARKNHSYFIVSEFRR